MALTPVEFGRFPGLDLRDDPQEAVGAVDLLNVEFTYAGRLKSREGWTKFNAGTITTVTPPRITSYVSSTGLRQIIVYTTTATRGQLSAYTAAGALLAGPFAMALGETLAAWVRVGPSGEKLFITVNPGANYYTWDGTSFTTSVSAIGGIGLAVTSDFRVLTVRGDRASFSDPGAPTTFGVNNFVDVAPFDGEDLVAAVTWQNQSFAFKNTKFFVFYGTDVDGSGQPIFNYRTVNTGVGMNSASPDGWVAAPEGLYFVGANGIYVTTGNAPKLVTDALTALWDGRFANTYQGLAVDTSVAQSLEWMENRLYMSFQELTSGTGKTLVYDLKTGWAGIWDIAASDLLTFNLQAVSGRNRLYFVSPTGTIGLYGQGAATDNGSAISSRYRTPFWNPGKAGTEADIFEWMFDGSGTITVKTSVNDNAALGAGASVTLGAAPAIAQGRDMRSVWGRNVSVELSASSAWQVSRMTANVAGMTEPGFKS